ncbi:hypothetical protein Y032_0142g2297 [Ancylostoma ceylanicum]|uniref:Reverse transcriptase domain-containing protein n=1 Tax=Ancylostoma ceylanicum TaxID=53326 RepID=A0A016T3N8_9BILA|nr:hypothetical protein Y032_0142g2297 [Ancylostoma ceylanicum]
MRVAMERNKDPAMDRILMALSEKLQVDVSEYVDSEKKSRSIVVAGLPEANPDLRPSERQPDLEMKVTQLLDVINVECRPTEVYRLGRPDKSRSRLVKIVFSSTAHWRSALSNAKLLRSSCLPNVFIRRSMSFEERKKDYELRQLAKERNAGKQYNEWVVYKVVITETWLTSKILDSEVIGCLPYTLLRVDRSKRRGGGVCCLIKTNYAARKIDHTVTLTADLLHIELFSFNLPHLNLVGIYRPPKNSSLEDDRLIQLGAEICSTHRNIILLGDFDLQIDWSTMLPLNSTSLKFLNFFHSTGLRQYVSEPTHGDNILDLILSPEDVVSELHLLPPLSTSDHSIVHFEIATELSESLDVPLPDFVHVDYKLLNEYLRNIDWLTVFDNYESASEVYRRFCSQLYSAFPISVKLRIKHPHRPEYPRHIRSLQAQKQRLFNSIPTPLSSRLYKKVCSDLEYHLKKFLANYERRLASKKAMGPLFQYLRKKMKPLSSVRTITDQSSIPICSDQSKADALGKYFASVFQDNPNNSPPTSFLSSIGHKCSELLIHPEETLRFLKNLKPSTTESFDGIPQIVYKKCALALYKPLTHIFNISLLLGEVPDLWRNAIITPIPKVSETKYVSDSRPISIIPAPAKVMEKIIREKLQSWFQRFHIIPENQHGFLAGSSTLTNLADCLFDWSVALNTGLSVDVIYVDLSKAFDKVNHHILLTRLDFLGVSDQLLIVRWLESYLTSRKLTVKVGTTFSEMYPCPSGVPQGEVLSPLLFLIYTADLSNMLKNSLDIHIKLYADDIKIYASFDSENRCEIQNKIQVSLTKISQWLASFDLEVNSDKCSVLHFGNVPQGDYSINGKMLKTDRLAKDLVVLIDSGFKFTDHVDKITNNALSVLFTILRSIQSTDPKILLRLYKVYVIPQLEYCSPVWNPHLKKQILKLERVQQTFTHLLYLRLYPRTRYEDMPSYNERLEYFHLDTLERRRLINDVVFCFKTLKQEINLKASKYWVFHPCNGRGGGLAFTTITLTGEDIHYFSILCFTALLGCLRSFPSNYYNRRIAGFSENFLSLLHMLSLSYHGRVF